MENTLVRRLEVKNQDELENIKLLENSSQNYIIIDTNTLKLKRKHGFGEEQKCCD